MAVDLFDRVAYSQTARRWYYRAGAGSTGFVAERTVVAELHQHLDVAEQTLRTLTENLFATGTPPTPAAVAQWEAACATEIANAHRANALFGAGGRPNMTSRQWGRVGGNLADEYRYLREFSQGIIDGTVSQAQAVDRITQYTGAAQQAYWNEWADVRKEAGVKINWVQDSGAESCGDCSTLAANSPYEPDELPTRPGAGGTQCRGNCRCHLEEVKE